MLTKQYNAVLRSAITGDKITLRNVTGSLYEGSIPLDSGTNYYFVTSTTAFKIPYLMQNRRTAYSNTSTSGFCFGTGTDTPTEDDYLFNTVIQLPSTVTVSVKFEQDGTEYKATYTLVNSSNGDITVNEVALVGCCRIGNNTPSYLIDRTLLDEPITIPANGGVGQIVYTVNIP